MPLKEMCEIKDYPIVGNTTSKINLLYIIDSLSIGGAQKQVITLLKHLDKEKYRIILCCLNTGGPLEKEIENEDIELVFMKMRLRYFYVVLYKLVRMMKEKDIQIVHTHVFNSSFWGRIAAWLAGVPVVLATEHGKGLWKKRRHVFFERIANHFTDMRIAVSDDVKRIRIQRENTSPEKVVTIPNAVNPDKFVVADNISNEIRKELSLERNELVVGTVARLDPDKGLKYLLETVPLVLNEIPNVQFLLIGDGELMEKLKSYAAELNIADKVKFLGFREDIAKYLSVIDVFVISSIREGIPVTLLEAMAAKKAVVATRVGGNPEVINSESVGILVPSENSKKLADAIISLLKDKVLRETMGHNARERILSHFSVSDQAKKLDDIYDNLLRHKAGNVR